jgi:predicted branched-subunit amino acid permease
MTTNTDWLVVILLWLMIAQAAYSYVREVMANFDPLAPPEAKVKLAKVNQSFFWKTGSLIYLFWILTTLANIFPNFLNLNALGLDATQLIITFQLLWLSNQWLQVGITAIPRDCPELYMALEPLVLLMLAFTINCALALV